MSADRPRLLQDEVRHELGGPDHLAEVNVLLVGMSHGEPARPAGGESAPFAIARPIMVGYTPLTQGREDELRPASPAGRKENKAVAEALFEKLDCLMFNVGDLEEALQFYREKLGLPLAWRTEGAAGLRVGESELVICQGPPREPETDIKVASAQEAARLFVEAGGSIVADPFDISIGKCVVVADPWGNKLVLLDSTKGTLRTDKDGWVKP